MCALTLKLRDPYFLVELDFILNHTRTKYQTTLMKFTLRKHSIVVFLTSYGLTHTHPHPQTHQDPGYIAFIY